MDAIIDISLIDNAAEEISRIYFLEPLDPFYGILTVEKNVELRLLAKPLVELVDDAVDPVDKMYPTLFRADSSRGSKHQNAPTMIETQAIETCESPRSELRKSARHGRRQVSAD